MSEPTTAPDWQRIYRAFSLVFSFVPDKDEQAEIERQYANDAIHDEYTAAEYDAIDRAREGKS